MVDETSMRTMLMILVFSFLAGGFLLFQLDELGERMRQVQEEEAQRFELVRAAYDEDRAKGLLQLQMLGPEDGLALLQDIWSDTTHLREQVALLEVAAAWPGEAPRAWIGQIASDPAGGAIAPEAKRIQGLQRAMAQPVPGAPARLR